MTSSATARWEVETAARHSGRQGSPTAVPYAMRHTFQAGRALGQIAQEPPPRCRLELRRAALGVEMDQLERVLEQELGHVAGRIFGEG
jgi:hypothetical protein